MPKKLVKGKAGRPKKTHRTSAVSKNRIKDRALSIGAEERLASYQKRALMLKRMGHYHHEIGEMIANEFDLERIPAVTTVADWLKAGSDAVARDIQELQWQARVEQFTDLERMKAKWMPVATAGSLEVRRWKMIEGELQPEMDEDAIKEQLEATKQVINIMNRQAKLLGLDIEKSIAETGEGPGSLQDLQVWLINQVNISTGAPNGAAIDIQSEVLELRSGIEEADDNGI